MLVVLKGMRHFLPGVMGVDFNALWVKYLRGGGAKCLRWYKVGAAPRATCGRPLPTSNCIRTHLGKR